MPCFLLTLALKEQVRAVAVSVGWKKCFVGMRQVSILSNVDVKAKDSYVTLTGSC
jgi:hypothetical protein